VSVPTKSRDVSLLMLNRKDMLDDVQVKKDKIFAGDKIRRDNMFLTFKGFDMDAGVLSFDLENEDAKLTNSLDVSIKYWQSNEYYSRWQ